MQVPRKYLLRNLRGYGERIAGAPVACAATLLQSQSNVAAIDATILPPPTTANRSAAARSRAEEYESPSMERTKPVSEIPGPKPLPILRNLLDFKNNVDRLIYFLEECHDKYGEIFKLEVPGQ